MEGDAAPWTSSCARFPEREIPCSPSRDIDHPSDCSVAVHFVLCGKFVVRESGL
jgi:hypothetical protein